MKSRGVWSENDENHREFHLYLEILAQMFHDYHCPSRQWIRRASRTSLAKVSVLVALLLPLPIQPSLTSSQFQRSQLKTTLSDKHKSVLLCIRLCFQ